MKKNRHIENWIKQDLPRKMVFVGGPRQVGKTTMALSLLNPASPKNSAYLNWDISAHQRKIIRSELPLSEKRVVFDEIHKYKHWRRLLKGIYDAGYGNPEVLVTGSARLDYYRKGGDSLVGRYHYYRLHPFSVQELNKNPNQDDLQQLFTFGGFPEPLLSQDSRNHKRWQSERNHRIIYEDLRDLENVKEISLIDLLLESLPDRVASILSLRSLSEDLQVSHASIDRWLTILENLYLVFRIAPFGSPRIRAVKKEQKLYFWDWSQIINPGARFENMVASHLLKYCHFLEDSEGYKMELRYIRDTDKREVDFVVLKEKNPQFAVECKLGEKDIAPAISYFQERTNIPEFYQVHMGKKDFGHAQKRGRVLPFLKFAKEKNIP